MDSINPSDGKIIETFEEQSVEEIDNIIDNSDKSFLKWKNTTFEYRSELMKKAASLLKNKKLYLAEIMAKEMGKPVTEGEAEIEKCALVCNYYAENAKEFLRNEYIQTDASKSYVRFDPLGVILAVMPWNFPFWQVFRFAAPALMAGNVCVLKHASNVQICSREIENIFKESGFPDYTFKSIIAGSKKIEHVLKNKNIKGVALTGSNSAGESVGMIAGREIKRSVLELGGSDPFIVLKDADLDMCSKSACTGRLINAGQSCIAAKRFIVVNEISKEFEKKLVEEMKNRIVGDPLDRKTQVGPMARIELMNDLHKQVEKSVQMGAKVILGGKPLGKTSYYLPTVLTNVKKGMPAYDEEVFGPVASIITVDNEEEAINVANDTVYGLGASIWTKNIEKAEKLAERIDSGSVFINGIVKSDPRMPFGGTKKSGYGRELSKYGILEFVNIKTVWIK